jgi:phage terminase large subunit
MKRLTDAKLAAVEKLVTTGTIDTSKFVFGIVSPVVGFTRAIKLHDGKWIETNEPVTCYIAECLEPALKSKKRHVIVIGGRGSSKSVGIADIILFRVATLGHKAFCIREYMANISKSVHALMKEEIKRLKLEGFRPLLTSIAHQSGGEIQYSGIATNPDGIKSAAGFNIFCSEESQFYSQKSLDILTPTARNAAKAGLPARFDPDKQAEPEDAEITDSAQMFFIGNPASSADPFSKRFIVPFKAELDAKGFYEDDLHLIIKMNYDDNPWFLDSGLEADRLFCLNNFSKAMYDHIWGGEFNDHVPDAIIPSEWFDACIDAHIKLNWKLNGAKFVTHDPADSGDKKAVCYRHGSVIMNVWSTDEGDANSACDEATNYAILVGANKFVWDAQGLGLGLRRQINDAFVGKDTELEEFFGSAGVEDPEGLLDGTSDGLRPDSERKITNQEFFANLRAQRYYQLRQRCYKTWRAVVHNDYCNPDEMISFSSEIKSIADLRSELCRIPRKRTGNGVFQVVSKDDMKNKLGMKSPNEADAVMMSLTDWQPKNVIDYSKFNIPSSGW